MDLKLPKDDIFIPQLQCEVYDYIFSGVINPTLGLFLLDINEIISETNRQIQEDEKITKAKLGYYLTKGLITNKQGALGQINSLEKKEEIINTSSKQNNDINNHNNEDHSISEEEIISQLAKDTEIKVSNRLYNNEFIENNKNISEYFVLLPQYKTHFIPGTNKHKGNKTPYKVENESIAPSKEYYMPIGYIPKPKRKLNNDNNINELNQNEGLKIENITKHYRRYFNIELEKVDELNIKSPFYTAYLRRGKDKEKKNDESSIFSAINDINNKIIKKYNSQNEAKIPLNLDKNQKNLSDRGYGKFKAVIRICEKEKMEKFQKAKFVRQLCIVDSHNHTALAAACIGSIKPCLHNLIHQIPGHLFVQVLANRAAFLHQFQ